MGGTLDFSSIGGKKVESGKLDFSSIGGKPVEETKAAPDPKVPWHTGVGDALWEEAKGVGDVAKGIALSTPPGMAYEAGKMVKSVGQAKENWQATKQSWKDEYATFKSDPYAYLLGHAPRALGQAAGMVVAGKAIPQVPKLVSGASKISEGTSLARLTERLAPMTEGEPTAKLVERVVPGLKLTGRESMEEVSTAAKSASMKVTAIENKIHDTPLLGHGGATIGNTPIPGSPIGKSLRGMIDENMKAFEPRLAKEIEKVASTYETQKWTPRRLQARLRTLNEESRAMYGKPDIEAALAQQNPKLKYLKTETDAVRNTYYDELSRLSGEDMRPLKRMQADLIGLQKATTKPVGTELKEAAESRAHPIIGPEGSLRRKALVGGAGAVGGVAAYKLGKNLLP